MTMKKEKELIHHLARLGQPTLEELETLRRLRDAQETLRMANNLVFNLIAKRLGLPESEDYMIMPDGKIVSAPKEK